MMSKTVALLAAVATTINAEFLFPDYSVLSTIALPDGYNGIQAHITALYNNKIYLFGGYNQTDETSLNAYTPMTKMWSLDISGWDLTLNEDNTNLTTEPTGAWAEETGVVWPDYGYGASAEFYCEHQCSAQIGNMLYIVASQAGDPLDAVGGGYMYRLDLSTLTFDMDGTFETNISDTVSRADPLGICATTDGTDLYYMTGEDDTTYFYGLVKYDVSTDTHEALTDLSMARKFASCVFNYDLSRIYMFGGRANANEGASPYGIVAVDWYSVGDETWTDNTDGNMYDASFSAKYQRCQQNPFTTIIECPGGHGASILSDVLLWDTANDEEYGVISMAEPAQYFSMVTIEIENTADIGSYLYLIFGGRSRSGSTEYVSDVIQYAVRYAEYTPQPTTQEPTDQPTTVEPTMQPTTKAPSEDGDTVSPSLSPTDVNETLSPTSPTEAPTMEQIETTDDDGTGGDAATITTMISFAIMLITVTIVLFQ